ncbi:MAG: ribosome small subunit-dependent GTPase A [Cyanobacteriota bacterium]
MLQGQIVKKHSNFYYVKTDGYEKPFECMLRERLKKEQIEVIVGDYVEIEEINETSNQAVISNIGDRTTLITRPHIANMNQNVITMSINKPSIQLLQLDRFIIHTLLAGLEPVICINKCDLKDKKKLLPQIKEIYTPLKIDIIEISAKDNIGLEELKNKLKNKTSVLSGPSGVGKSTIINTLKPELNLKIGLIGKKSQKGIHTTRHTELIEIDFENNTKAILADTPGFSYLRFDKYLPEEVEAQFFEFAPYRKNCYFSDCLHLNEDGCEVKNSLKKINSSRYESYCKFISEAYEYKEKLSSISIKDEGLIKTLDGSGKNQIRRLKLGYNLVESSRKTYKQKLTSIASSENPEDNYDETLD